MSSKLKKIGIPAAVAIALVGAAAWYFLIRDTSPERADISSAVEAVEDAGGDVPAEAVTPDEGSSGPFELEGTWTLDPTIGEFSIEDTTGSFIGFRIDEVLGGGIGNATAVGRAPATAGELTFEGTNLMAATISGDLSALGTDRSIRDGRTHV